MSNRNSSFTHTPSKYEITRYEIAACINGQMHSLGVCYPKSRDAMLRTVRAQAANATRRTYIAGLLDGIEGGEWNGKTQRWEKSGNWFGFSGRTERDRDLAR